MRYEASHDATTELTHGNLTVHFLRCVLGNDQQGPRPEIWSAAVRESILELSSAYFRKHGCNCPKSAMYWIDFGKGGLAVKVKASSMKLQPDRAKQYRIILRRYVDKVWRLRNQSSCCPAPSISRGLKVQLSSNENHKLRLMKRVFEVYVPLTSFSCLTISSSFYLSLDLHPAVRQHISTQLSDNPSVITPLVPFEAVKVLAPARGAPFIASFSGEDSVATYLLPEELNGHALIRENEKVEIILPSIAMQPVIKDIYKLMVKTYFDSSKSAEAPSFQTTGEPVFDAPNLIVDVPTFTHPLTTSVVSILTPRLQPETFTASADGRTTAGAQSSPPSTEEGLGRCDEYSPTEIMTDGVPSPTEENEIFDSPSTTDRQTPVDCCTVHNASVVPSDLQRKLVGQFLRCYRHTSVSEDSASIQLLRLSLRLQHQQPGTMVLHRQIIDEVLTRIDLSILQPSRFYCAPSILRTLSVPTLIEEYGTCIFMTPTDEYETMHSSIVVAPPTVHIATCTVLPSAVKRKFLDSPPPTSIEGRGFKERRTVVALPYTLKPATAVVSSPSMNPATVCGLTSSRTLAWSPQTSAGKRELNECRTDDLATAIAFSYTLKPATAVASFHCIQPAAMNSLAPCMEGRTFSSPLAIDVDRQKFNKCRTVDLATSVALPPSLEPAIAVASPHNVEHATVYPLPPTSVERRGFDLYQTAECLTGSQLAFTAPRVIRKSCTDAFRPSDSDRQLLRVVKDKEIGNLRGLGVSQGYAAISFRNFKPSSRRKRSSYFLRCLLRAIIYCVIFIGVNFILMV